MASTNNVVDPDQSVSNDPNQSNITTARSEIGETKNQTEPAQMFTTPDHKDHSASEGQVNNTGLDKEAQTAQTDSANLIPTTTSIESRSQPHTVTTAPENTSSSTPAATTQTEQKLQESQQSQQPESATDSSIPPKNTIITTTTTTEPPHPLSVETKEDSQPTCSTPLDLSSPINPSPPTKDFEEPGPTLLLNLLLITGARHPFKIDGRYLRKRDVNVADHDPYAMSVYTLKELIWREWRSDWETRPSSPGSIRLISFGKLLEDKAPLSSCKFNRDTPNVVHMTVKPQEVVDEEDAKAPKSPHGREREDGERSPGCRCIIL